MIRQFLKTRKAIAFYKKLIPTNIILFDVGANTGMFTNYFLQTKPKKLVCIEPFEGCVTILNSKYKFNTNVIIEPCGLGALTTELPFFEANNHQVNSFSKQFVDTYSKQTNSLKWQKGSTVPITTLSKLIKKHGQPFFVKIDTEGFELEVVKGLSTPIDLISIEYNKPLQKIAFDSLLQLQKLGKYEFNFSPYENFNFTLDNWLGIEEMINYLTNEMDANILTGDIFAKLISN